MSIVLQKSEITVREVKELLDKLPDDIVVFVEGEGTYLSEATKVHLTNVSFACHNPQDVIVFSNKE